MSVTSNIKFLFDPHGCFYLFSHESGGIVVMHKEELPPDIMLVRQYCYLINGTLERVNRHITLFTEINTMTCLGKGSERNSILEPEIAESVYNKVAHYINMRDMVNIRS